MRAKKSLGQNFLNSQTIAKDIAREGVATQERPVLEIGPGKGVLTKELLTVTGKVFAVEKDVRMVALLQEKFAKEIAEEKLILINEDILDFNPQEHGLVEGKYSLIANIPYYITGEILRKFLSGDNQPAKMVLMLQKEVAERIVARPARAGGDGKESILSLSVKAYGTPRIIKKVPARYFTPAPKVDSAVLVVEGISKNYFATPQEESRFFKVIKTGFAHKRKLLIRNLESIYTRGQLEQAFTECNLCKEIRAEKIPLEQWFCLNSKLGN